MSASIAVEVIVDNMKAIDAILTEMIITQHSIIITIGALYNMEPLP